MASRDECFLCEVVVALDEGGAKIFFGSGDGERRGHADELHPYLGETCQKRVCSHCWLRVRFTREGLRALSNGQSLKPLHKLDVKGWDFPAIAATLCGPHKIITLPLATAKAPESACMICALERKVGEDGNAETLLACNGCTNIRYHQSCVGAARMDADWCPCCRMGGQDGAEALREGELRRDGKTRAFEPWEGVQKKIVAKNGPAPAFASKSTNEDGGAPMAPPASNAAGKQKASAKPAAAAAAPKPGSNAAGKRKAVDQPRDEDDDDDDAARRAAAAEEAKMAPLFEGRPRRGRLRRRHLVRRHGEGVSASAPATYKYKIEFDSGRRSIRSSEVRHRRGRAQARAARARPPAAAAAAAAAPPPPSAQPAPPVGSSSAAATCLSIGDRGGGGDPGQQFLVPQGKQGERHVVETGKELASAQCKVMLGHVNNFSRIGKACFGK